MKYCTFSAILYFSVFVLIGCTSESYRDDSIGTTEEAELEHEESNETPDTFALTTEPTLSQTEIQDFLVQMGNNYAPNRVAVPYELLDEWTAKKVFTYADSFVGIDVNLDGITYTGIYELVNGDTLLRHVTSVPELEMEGSFINYENDPSFIYSFENGSLQQVDYIDPKDEQAMHPYEQSNALQLKVIGDSVRTFMNDLFLLNDQEVDYAGDWRYEDNDETYMFNISLQQMGDFVQGNYCAYTPNKFDCQNEEQGGDPCVVSGYVLNDTLYVGFFSCYAIREGTAKLFYQKDSLVWETLYNPENGLAPERARLLPLTD